MKNGDWHSATKEANVNNKKRKNNKQFMILSALGILFVLDKHSGGSLSLFTHIFPYNSFFMPMFVFISGYFFKDENLNNVISYIWKKVKSLVLPYYAYNVFYGLITVLLVAIGVVNWTGTFTVHNLLVVPWVWGTPFDVSSASWFVLLLFEVIVLYVLIRKICNKLWNDHLAMLVLLVFGVFAVFLCRKGLYTNDSVVVVLKMLFFVPFFHLGYYYRKYLESYLNKVPDLLLVIACILTNIFLLSQYSTEQLCFNNCAFMSGFKTENYILPFITSLTGILFWLIIAKWLVACLGENRIINYISDNTFVILLSHLFFFNVLNVIVYILTKSPLFDIGQFKMSAWYIYYPFDGFGVVYILFALIGSLGMKYCIDKIKGCNK